MAVRQALAALILLFCAAAPAAAEDARKGGDETRKGAEETRKGGEETRKGAEEHARGLPAEAVTSHTLAIDGDKIAFTARAGALRLRDAQTEAPQADVAFVSYERNGADAATRPVAFVFNGGPGAGSAWLQLGALSPFRLRVTRDTLSPSLPPIIVDNAESWLPFVDLVFIDPPGTGFSKILTDSDDVKKRFFSAEGDADALAVVVRKWLTARGRLASPKYLVGESYGGFRCVKLLDALRERESVGVSGLVLISPVLDFGLLQGERHPLWRAALLPSFAAIARNAADRAALADAEAYAAGDFVTDYLKGEKDAAAISRMSAKVAELTGLDPALVARLGARVDPKTFARERLRDKGRVLSVYDGEVSRYDPTPFSPESDWADPVLESWRAPLGAAMTRLMLEKLQWPIGDARYTILNSDLAHRWDYGHGGRAGADVISPLRGALALDPRLRVIVLHGLYDLVTPYFATRLLLDQLPALGDPGRVSLLALRGGHMPYLEDESRKAMRDAARAFLERP
ncbi:MAG: S10 family peptidase [Methylocystis sp.]|uniref:S10 family peptidase n=1 Tax=Methylocystis sp. TaxID=1911079 RepID=UPI003DA1EBC4